MTAADRLAEIRNRIARAERIARRPVGSTTLVAVSKTFGTDAVTEVIDHGSPAGDVKGFDIKAFAGTYAGMLPCADCPGIDSTIAFTPEGTYTLSETYQDADKSSFLSKGTWSLRGDGKAVLLDPEDKDEYDRAFAIASPTELRALDQQGKPIEGTAEYSLKRK